MISTEPISPNVLSLFVYDEIVLSEMYVATACLFIVVENVSMGYQYTGSGDIDDRVLRAFDILFDETIKRMEPEDGRLFSIDN